MGVYVELTSRLDTHNSGLKETQQTACPPRCDGTAGHKHTLSHTHACAHTCTHDHTHTYILTHMLVHTHTKAHTYTHMCTHVLEISNMGTEIN